MTRRPAMGSAVGHGMNDHRHSTLSRRSMSSGSSRVAEGHAELRDPRSVFEHTSRGAASLLAEGLSQQRIRDCSRSIMNNQG